MLADPTVDVAVLETARGGLLREGLAYDRADVGVVLNVTADHLGLKGVDTLGQLARVKSVVVRDVRRRGTSVLNADDPRTVGWPSGPAAASPSSRWNRSPPGLRESSRLGRHRDGPRTLRPGRPARAARGRRANPLVDAAAIPATWGGIAGFNVSNAQAAVAATRGHGIAVETIVDGLCTFSTSFEQNPGRFNVTDAPGFTTIVDYAHNPAALHALGAALRRLAPTAPGRTIGVISTPGDRRDDDILELGRLAAEIFDEVVFRELPDGRGRAAGGVVALLQEGAIAAGMPPERIRIVFDEAAAMDTALRMARPSDLVALTVTDVDAVWRQVQAFRPAERVDA